MKALPIIAIGTVAALGLAGAAYAATRDEDQPPLGPPADDCSTAAEVNAATSEVLSDNTVDAKGLRGAADVLRNWTTYCDDAARDAGKASIALLEAKAKLLEDPGLPSPYEEEKGGSIWPVPPGYTSSKQTAGLHGEAGKVYVYANGDMWFFPDNSTLIPYYIPGGSKDIKTEGCKGCRDE